MRAFVFNFQLIIIFYNFSYNRSLLLLFLLSVLLRSRLFSYAERV